MVRKMMLLCACLLLGSGTLAVAQTNKPAVLAGMFALYDANRAEGVGNYITADFVLTGYNLLLRDVVTTVEEKELAPALRALADGLTNSLSGAMEKQGGSDPGERMALAYSVTLQKLLDPGAKVPNVVAAEVAAELKLIAAHARVEVSPVSGVREDYTQYLPRGKYAASETMSRYFLAMTYASRIGFYLKESKATGVTPELADRQTSAAMAMTFVLQEDKKLADQYRKLMDILDFFVGQSDDLGISDYAQVLTLPAVEARGKVLDKARTAGRLPRIVGGLVDGNLLEAGVTIPEVTAGFRLIGQRFTPESQAFQWLTFNAIGDYLGENSPPTMVVVAGHKVRGFPSVLDLLATLGAEKARLLLQLRGDSNYSGYGDNFKSAALLMKRSAAAPSGITEMNLRLCDLAIKGNPSQGVNTALGTWSQNRHNFMLYAKQSYTVIGKGLRMDPPRSEAAVEPALVLYGAMVENLFRIAEATPVPDLKGKIINFRQAVEGLRSVAIRQEEKTALPGDAAYLNNFDRTLQAQLSGTDAPVVVDIHTEANTASVLQLGVGAPLSINSGKLRGGVYNVYEFTRPMDKRMTDVEWKQVVEKEEGRGNLSGLLL